MSKKKSEKDIPTEILNKIKDIEEKLETLEDQIKGIEVKSHLNLEDQLFFGLVFSLLILVITFPSINDMVSFFEDIPLTSSNAFSTAFSLKLFLIVTLFPASLYRYYGAIRKSQFAQYQSIRSLLFTSFFFVFMIIFVFLGQFLYEIVGENMLSILSLILILLALGLGVAEKMILGFYHSIGQLTVDKYLRVEASHWLLVLGMCLFILSFTFVTLTKFFVLPFPSVTPHIIVLVSFLLPSYLIMWRYRVKIDRIFEKICERIRKS